MNLARHPAARSSAYVLLLASLALTACSPSGGTAPPADTADARPARTLVIGIREPSSLTTRPLADSGQARTLIRDLFNAQIAQRDERGQFGPWLVEALPQMNTGSWRVFPDGRMETTYRIKSGITWQDGTPLTAEDFVFSYRVHAEPLSGLSALPPFSSVDSVVASDDRTFVIRWSRPYPEAGTLSSPTGAQDDEFQPLPRHLLERDLSDQPDNLVKFPYWTTEFVGLGPFRLDRWEPGAFLEASPFDRYVLGRPRIERIKIQFMRDQNTVVANLLAGEVHFTADNTIGFENVQTLRQAGWPGVTTTTAVTSWRLTWFQFRPELVNPQSILDIRVRRALAHAADRAGVSQVAAGGDLQLADSMFQPGEPFGMDAARGAERYPYDLRRAEQLMNEAGFTKGPDGFFTGPGGRFNATLSQAPAAGFEQEIFILSDGWRKAGLDVQEIVIPAAQSQNSEVAATFPAMSSRTTRSGATGLPSYTTRSTPTSENRWVGQNRGGWYNPEFDQLVDRFTVTLDEKERGQQVEAIVRIFTTDMPSIPLYFNYNAMAYLHGLRGILQVPSGGNQLSNVHEWEFV